MTRVGFGGGDSLVIGRGGASDVVLDHPSVSRRHAVLRGAGDSFVVEQQGGGPVSVDGRAINRAELSPPARIVIGEFVLDVTAGQPARPAFRIESASREDKIAWAGAACQHLARVFKGNAVPRRDERGQIESWELQLAVGGRPVRIQLDNTWLTPTTEARVQNTRGMLFLIHDPEAVPITSAPGDAWGDQRKDDRTFLAPNIYTEVEMCVPVWNSLDERAKHDLVTFLTQHQLLACVVAPDIVTIRSRTALSDSPRIEATAGEMIRFVVQVAGMFEGAHQWIGFSAGNPEGGGATYGHPPEVRGPPVDCSFCNSSCLLNERSMCPNCGAPLQIAR